MNQSYMKLVLASSFTLPHHLRDSYLEPAAPVSQYKDTEVCFKYFTKLPPEIRLIIWELAIPARVLNVWNIATAQEHLSFTPQYSVPAVAHACYDSRRLVRRTGGISTFGTPMTDPGKDQSSISWFDSHRDTLRIYGNSAVEYLPQSVENVIFCLRSLLYYTGGVDMKLSRLPKLRHAGFEIDWRFVPSEIWHIWESLRGRARDGSMLLDIDDDAEVRMFAKVLRNRSRWQYSHWCKEIGYLRHEKFRRSLTSEGYEWKVIRKELEDKWIADHKVPCARVPRFSRVLSLIPFPEGRYEEGVGFYGKDSFMLFHIANKSERRFLQFEGWQSVLSFESRVKTMHGLLPRDFIDFQQRRVRVTETDEVDDVSTRMLLLLQETFSS